MPKIVIHGAVLKGRHVYDTEAVMGGVYDCH